MVFVMEILRVTDSDKLPEGDKVRVSDAVFESEKETLLLSVIEGLLVVESVREGVRVIEYVAEFDSLTDAEGLSLIDCEGDAEQEEESEGELLSVSLNVGVKLVVKEDVIDIDSVEDLVIDAVRVEVSVPEAETVRVADADRDSVIDPVAVLVLEGEVDGVWL